MLRGWTSYSSSHFSMGKKKSLYCCAPLDTMRWARQGQHYGTLVTREPQCLENHHTAAELLTGLSLLGLATQSCLRWAIQVAANQGRGFYTGSCTHDTILLCGCDCDVKFASSCSQFESSYKTLSGSLNW